MELIQYLKAWSSTRGHAKVHLRVHTAQYHHTNADRSEEKGGYMVYEAIKQYNSGKGKNKRCLQIRYTGWSYVVLQTWCIPNPSHINNNARACQLWGKHLNWSYQEPWTQKQTEIEGMEERFCFLCWKPRETCCCQSCWIQTNSAFTAPWLYTILALLALLTYTTTL